LNLESMSFGDTVLDVRRWMKHARPARRAM